MKKLFLSIMILLFALTTFSVAQQQAEEKYIVHVGYQLGKYTPDSTGLADAFTYLETVVSATNEGIIWLDYPVDSVGQGAHSNIHLMGWVVNDTDTNWVAGAGQVDATTLGITGNATIGGTLGVTGATTLGATTLSSLTVTGGSATLGNMSFFGEMYLDENTTAITPVAADEYHMTYFTTGLLNGFTFDAGGVGSYTEVASYGGGDSLRLLSTGHTIIAGDFIRLAGGSVGAYDGLYTVALILGDTIVIPGTFSATGTGTYSQGSAVVLSQVGVSARNYEINWVLSVAQATGGEYVDVGITINGVAQAKGIMRKTITVANEFESMQGSAVLSLTTADRVGLWFASEGTNALTFRNGSVIVKQK